MTFMKYFYVFLDLPWLMQKHNAALVLGLYTSNHQISNMLCYFSCLSTYASSSLDALSNLRNALFVVTDACCIVCIVALPTLLVVCFSPHLQWTFHDDR